MIVYASRSVRRDLARAAGWWVDARRHRACPIQKAFAAVSARPVAIAGSLVAFMLGQLIDIAVFQRIRSMTGEKHVWMRATGSTAVSQLVDSFVVLYIAFVLGPQHWEIPKFLAISTVNYGYKMLAAIALIPLIYLVRAGITGYLGEARARQLRHHAADSGIGPGSRPPLSTPPGHAQP